VAIVFDAASEFERTATTDPQTWTHTPTGTPRAVVVAIVHGTSTTDHVSTVTYGGVSMGESVRATDAATELGAAELWFLGSGIPTGAQTVSVDLASATTDDIHFVCMTWTAGANCEVIDTDAINSGDPANPSVTLQYGGREAVAVAALYGGGASPAQFTPNANCTTVHDNDLGAFYSEVIRQTNAGTSDFAIGGTSSADDVGYAALAFAERVGITATAGLGALTAAGLAPTVTATNNLLVTAGVGALVLGTDDQAPTVRVGIPVSFATSFTGTNGSTPGSLTPELGSPLNEIYREGAAVTVQGGYLTASGTLDADYGWYSNGGEYAVSIVVRTRSGVAGVSDTEVGVLGAALAQTPVAFVEWTSGGGFTLTYGMWTAPIDTVNLGWGFGEIHTLRLQVAGTTARVLVDGAEVDSWTVALTAPWLPYLAFYMDDPSTQLAAEVSSLIIAPSAAGVVLTEPGALTATGFAPTVSATANQLVTAGLGALIATGFAPTVSATANQIVTPELGAATVAGLAPSVSATAHVTASAALGELTATGHAPTIGTTAHVTASAGVGALEATGYVPTVSVSSAQGITPGTGALVAAGFAPVVTATAHQVVAPETGLLILTSFLASITASDHQVVAPGAGVLALMGYEPSVAVSESGPVSVACGVGVLVATGYEPSVAGSVPGPELAYTTMGAAVVALSLNYQIILRRRGLT
jgi:hypothetical protein